MKKLVLLLVVAFTLATIAPTQVSANEKKSKRWNSKLRKSHWKKPSAHKRKAFMTSNWSRPVKAKRF